MVKYLKDGEDFGPAHFSKSFGFGKSAGGAGDDDGTYVGKARARPIHRATGGPVQQQQLTPQQQQQQRQQQIAQQIAIQQSMAAQAAQGQRAPGTATPMRRGGKVKGYAVGGAAQMPMQTQNRIPIPTQRAAGVPAAPRPPAAPRADGQAGMMSHATITMPVRDALQGTAKMLQAGRSLGAHQAVGVLAGMARDRGMVPSAPTPAATMSPAAAPPPAPAQQGIPQMARGGHLTTKARNALPKADFALPGGRYPIENASHARNALARVSQNGSPAEKARVRAKVHSKYPDIGDK